MNLTIRILQWLVFSIILLVVSIPISYARNVDEISLSKLRRFEYEAPLKITSMKKKNVSWWKKLFLKYDTYNGSLRGINPVDQEEFDTPFIYYRWIVFGKKPLFIIFPNIGGVTILETMMGEFFAQKGYHAIISVLADDVTDKNRPSDQVDEFFIKATTSSRLVLDMACQFKEVDCERVGAFGASLGGIRTLTLLGVETRVKAAVTYVAGVNLPSIMAYSEQKTVKNWRKYRMAQEGFQSQSDFEDHLHQVVDVDPEDFAHLVDRRDVYMVVGLKDTSVPTANQYEAIGAFGNPKVKNIGMGHVETALTALVNKNEALIFMLNRIEQKLKEEKSGINRSIASVR